jgi:hypothetical protein
MADMIQADVNVLKTDVVGRIRTPPERRDSLLDEFERSGLSGTKFAELAGIKYPTFAAWVAQRRKQRGGAQPVLSPAGQVRWLEAVVAQAKPPSSNVYSAVRIQLPSGVCLEVADRKQIDLVAALIHALQKPLPAC